MEISRIKPSNIVDADQVDEVIYFFRRTSLRENDFFYTKCRYLTNDLNGNPILESDNHIRTKSLWYTDLLNGQAEEIVPYGSYDIAETHIAQNYVYFTKILDKDNDGLLGEEDYENGAEI